MTMKKQRFSEQRNTILGIVKQAKIHPSADWIYKETRKKMPNISLGTVYRNLNQLVEKGQISMIKDKTLIRYDGNILGHDHFCCTNCNTWYDVDILDKQTIDAFSQSNNFKIDTISLELVGTCATCLTNS